MRGCRSTREVDRFSTLLPNSLFFGVLDQFMRQTIRKRMLAKLKAIRLAVFAAGDGKRSIGTCLRFGVPQWFVESYSLELGSAFC